MRILTIILLLTLTSCGPYKVKVDKIKGETSNTFGPDFKHWLDYCTGKVNFENKKFNYNYTKEELTYHINDCYYNLNLFQPIKP